MSSSQPLHSRRGKSVTRDNSPAASLSNDGSKKSQSDYRLFFVVVLLGVCALCWWAAYRAPPDPSLNAAAVLRKMAAQPQQPQRPQPLKDIEEWVEVRESPIHGLGLFAKRNIPAKTHITRYVGPYVHRREEETMTEDQKAYLFALDKDYSIDGSDTSNLARYINHLCSGWNAHVYAKWVAGQEAEEEAGGRWKGGSWELWVVSDVDIAKGTELTINYGENYWSDGRVCNCGAPNCISHRHPDVQ